MNWLNIDLIRSHVRVEYDCENDLLDAYGDAAEAAVLNILNTTYEGLIDKYGSVPGPIIHARGHQGTQRGTAVGVG